jgi:hypothetical protein
VPTATRPTTRIRASSMLVSVPAAASVTSRYSPSGVKLASCGERKWRNTASRRSRALNIVTVPEPGLTTATGAPGAAATVFGSEATGMRRTTGPPGSDTTTSSFLSSAVTSATWVRCRCSVIGRADALLGDVVDVPVGAIEDSVPGWAAPEQDAHSNKRSRHHKCRHGFHDWCTARRPRRVPTRRGRAVLGTMMPAYR